MLEMKSIDKRFGAVVALHDASLTVQEGEIAALAGSNGSGKSTMVKVLAGLVAPNAGEIFIDGEKKVIHSGTDSTREGIATAFQDLSLIPTMSVKDNILLGCEVRTKSGMVDEKISRTMVQELLDQFSLEIRGHLGVGGIRDQFVQLIHLLPDCAVQTGLSAVKTYHVLPGGIRFRHQLYDLWKIQLLAVMELRPP